MLTATGVQPSAGEIASLYCELGGNVTFVGKPYGAMYSFARNQRPGADPIRTIAIGDSVEHDICGGINAGLATAIVLTGLSHNLSDDELSDRLGTYGVVPNFVVPGLCWE